MQQKNLKSPPLIEVIFEVKWKLEEVVPGVKRDPHYSLLVGRLYERLQQDYPFHETLPSASIPSEMAEGVVQHRFRWGQGKWPVTQVGPGVFTVNDTTGYTWKGFKKSIIQGVDALCEAYPDSQNFIFDSLMLRYINGVEFNFDRQDIFEFLREEMAIDVSLTQSLFTDKNVSATPLGLDWKFAFACKKPQAVINLRFSRGQKHNVDALIWQTNLVTRSDDIPKLPMELTGWLENAHSVIEDWFFKLIEGNLQKRFE